MPPDNPNPHAEHGAACQGNLDPQISRDNMFHPSTFLSKLERSGQPHHFGSSWTLPLANATISLPSDIRTWTKTACGVALVTVG